MALLTDQNDPTTALFLSPASAEAAGVLVRAQYPKTVTKTRVKARRVRGECVGHALIAFKTDGTSAPITNSDFERLTA